METPGVSISTVMDRVREDVWNETGKKQKPWVNTSIIGEFMLNPAVAKVAALPTSNDTAPSNASRQPVALDRAQMDVKMWESAEKANTAEDYQAYLDAFPTGQFATFAKNRIAKFKAAAISATKEPTSEDELKIVGSSKTENAIGLDNGKRREISTRLKAIGFDPGAIDGKFGPTNRSAIAQWQTSRQLAATGYLTGAQKGTLEAQSEEAYQLALSTPKEPVATPSRTVSHRASGGSVRSIAVAKEPPPVRRRKVVERSSGGDDQRADARPRRQVVERSSGSGNSGGDVGAAGIGTALGIMSIVGGMRGGMRGGGLRFGF
jgi:peptidoglycan hydrolase-like protein with peptidoglycan-binding domain